MPGPHTVTDDRGVAHPIARHEARAADEPGDIAYRIGSTIAMLVILVPFLFIGSAAVSALVDGHWVLGAVLFVFGTPVLVAILSIWMAENRASVDWMRSRNRCAACGYDIAGLDADASDGATTCPECGAAWMLTGATASEP